MKKYTLVVEYHQGHNVNGTSGTQIADLSEAEVNNYAARIWAVGIRVATTPGTWEIVSPYIISRVWIMENENS